MEHEPPLSTLYSALVDNHGAEQAQLPSSAQATELVDSSTSGDSCCDDLTLEQVLGWSAGEPEMAAGPLAASPEEIQERLFVKHLKPLLQ